MKVQVLSLANIPNLKSSVLEGLLPSTEVDGEESIDAASRLPSVLRDLNLSDTAVDDEAVPFLASCKNLTRLNLEATKMSGGQKFSSADCPEQTPYDCILQVKVF
jgi:hypothetical protein